MKRVALVLCATLAAGAALAEAAVGAQPTVRIDGGPSGNSVLRSAAFTFSADRPATFECAIDSLVYSACASPQAVGPLDLGPHIFAVRAISTESGEVSEGVAREWSVVAPITPPTIALQRPVKRSVKGTALRTLSGTASSPSGVMRVQLALALGGPDKDYFPPLCHFVNLATGKPDPRPCLLPRYVVASGTTAWTYTIPARVRRHLVAGRYRLTVRAFNAYQQATQKNFTLKLH